MRKWGLVVTAFYTFVVVALLVPLVLLLQASTPLTTSDLRKAYGDWLTWIPVGLVILSQVLLLWLSVDTSRRRLKPRTPVFISAITSGFLVMVLAGLIWLSVAVAIWGDDPPKWSLITLCVVTGSWIFWGILFYRLWRNSGDPVTRAVVWLFRGSVLELLVAVPAHVIVRRRHDCCAPAYTAFGIATGIAIMLLSFGPSVLLLFKKRMERYATKAIAL